MGKFTTQRVAEDGAIWATRQEPSASQNSIYAVRGESSLADSVNYKHRFEVDGKNGEKINNYKLKGSTLQPDNETDPAYQLGASYKFSGMEILSENFERNMKKKNIPKDIRDKLESAFVDDKMTIKDVGEAVDVYANAMEHGRDARFGSSQQKMKHSRDGIGEWEKYEGIFSEAKSGRKLRDQLWNVYGESKTDRAASRTDDIAIALDLSKKRTKMVENQATAWEKKNERDFHRTISKGRDSRGFFARSWSKITGRKPGYLVQAEAQLKASKVEVKQAEAALIGAENEIKKAKGKGGYQGTKAEVRQKKLEEKVKHAESVNDLAETKNRAAVVQFQRATVARRRQASDAAGYFQKRFLGTAAKQKVVTEADVRNWERMSRFKDEDRYFSGVAKRRAGAEAKANGGK